MNFYLNFKLFFNFFFFSGAVALAEFIADNQHIASIDLTGNEIKLAGLMALALSLNHNQSMISLKVDQTIKVDEVITSFIKVFFIEKYHKRS